MSINKFIEQYQQSEVEKVERHNVIRQFKEQFINVIDDNIQSAVASQMQDTSDQNIEGVMSANNLSRNSSQSRKHSIERIRAPDYPADMSMKSLNAQRSR